MFLRKLKYIVAIAVVVGLTAYICIDIFFPNGFGSDDDDNAAAVKKTALNIGVPNNISSLPVWIAEEDSLFDSLRVDITVKDFTDPMDCDVAFSSGKTNLCITESKRADWLKTAKKQTYSEVMTLPMPYALVASHNARINSISQLKNKLLGSTRNSTYSASLQHCLDSVKLNKDSVYVVQINNPNVAMLMLHNNELDAAFVPEPYISLGKVMGHKPLYSGHTDALLISRHDLPADQLGNFNKAINEALNRIRKNGVSHYTALIAKRCKCSPQFEKELKVKF